ncbi:Choline dehydrogenase mitochondrial [Fasciola hepatica]|uniref:Choline dehydrogenase mitochondrial n=1 Tax=Fasciola hepatica TaxID=6192 RepID=A0A4E0RRQ1_FASHE|nr:Choline dehydrogenase mitochondrial [Fasciola hepatica]
MQQLLLPSGRVVGGSAILNALIFSLGHKSDKAVRLFHSAELFGSGTNSNGCHCKPELVNRHWTTTRIHDALRDLFHGLGIPVHNESNGWISEGLYTPLVFTENGKRWHPYEKCLHPVLSSNNADVFVAPNTVVDRLVWDEKLSDLAAGVRLVHRGIPISAMLSTSTSMHIPRSEVVLSAGAFETPSILLRSGIGPSDVYKPELNITQRKELPVGYNLHDHPVVGVICKLASSVTINSRSLTLMEILRYWWKGEGLLAHSSALTSVAYLRTSVQREQNRTGPDIQLTFVAAAAIEHDTFRKLGNFNPTAWRRFIPSNGENSSDTMVILVTVVTPQSRGRVRLRSSSVFELSEPFPQPEVDPAYLTHPTDLERLVEALSWIWAVFRGVPNCYRPARPESQRASFSLHLEHRSAPEARMALRQLSLEPHLPNYPSCPTIPKCTDKSEEETLGLWDAALVCLVRSAIISNFHYAGTSPVQGVAGPVLSERLSVLHIKNVRVADASVIPVLPSSNPATLVMSIGQYAAKHILNDYERQLDNSVEF